MRQRQQMQASQIFRMQQKHYEQSHLGDLDNYIVSSSCMGGEGEKGGGLHEKGD